MLVQPVNGGMKAWAGRFLSRPVDPAWDRSFLKKDAVLSFVLFSGALIGPFNFI